MKKRVLAIVSNPIDTPRLDLDSEIRDLQEAFQRSQHRDRFVFEWRIVKTYEDFRRCILDVKPNIIHFCGHGTKEGLVLADDRNHAKVAGNEVLADFLKVYADRIECFLLNACDTEPLANALIQHLNYVVGMNQPVYDDAAKAFAQSFYDGIGAGDLYETAFEIGRNAVLGKRFGAGRTFKVVNRKLFAVEQDGEQIEIENQEHLIPVIKVSPSPTPIKPLWLDPEVERQAVRDLLEAIEGGFNTIKLFHADELIVLKDQYIPVQVTLERRYQHTVETIGGYAESEAELKRLYALKGGGEEELKRQQVDWQEARRQQARIVVLADPGMGKSTLLRMEVGTTVQQAYQALEAGRPLKDMTLPLLIRLATLADEIAAMSTVAAILKLMPERHSHLLKHHADPEVVAFLNGFLKEQLLSGKVLLLLDALDEVPDGKRNKLLEKLNEFAKAYPTCVIVGTSRIVGYGGRLVDGAKDMEIVPFNQKQTEEYIETWFRHAPLKDESVSARGLIQALRERPQIAGLAQNPLLLSLLCSLYQRDQLTLPARRSQIYEQAVSYMLGGWSHDNFRQSSDDSQIATKAELLEELAYQFSCKEKEVFSIRELRQKVKDYLRRDNATDLDEKANRLINELSEQDGILQKLNPNENQYLFLHRTFQEYFTASYLNHKIEDDRAEGIQCIKQYFWNYDWHETLTLLAGLMKKPMGLIAAIAAEKDDIFQTQLLLAGRCLAECSQISEPLIDNLLDRIYQFWLKYPDTEFVRSVVVAIGQTWMKLVQNLQMALNHEDSTVRWKTAAALRQIGRDKAVDAFITALNDEDRDVKWRTAAALGQSGSDQAVDALITALNDEYNLVRRKVAAALGKSGSDEAVDAFITALNDEDRDVKLWRVMTSGQIGSYEAVEAITALNDEYNLVRRKVAAALGKSGSDKAVDPFITALNDEDRDVRWNAAWTLGQIGSDKAVEALITALNDEDSGVKWRAAAALGQIGSDKAVDAFITALNYEDGLVRRKVAAALGQSVSDQAVDALITALNDKDRDVKWRTVSALGQIGSNQAVEAITALNDEYNLVRRKAAWALGQIGSDKAVDAFITALNDEDRNLRWNAAWALEQIGSDQAVEALITALNDEDSGVKWRTAAALGQIGSDQAIDALITALNDEDGLVRRKAAAALGQIGSDQAVDALITALNDEDGLVRRKAAAALGQIGSDQAIDALITALNDEYRGVRWNAAWALGQIGSDQAVDALSTALNHEDGNLRLNAAAALGQIGSDQAVDALSTALNHKGSDVREKAAESLGQIGRDTAVDALIPALNDEDSTVRRKAAESLGQIGRDTAVDALIPALNDEDSTVREQAAAALRQIGSAVCLEKLLQSAVPHLIERSDIFSLARSWAIRFSKAELPFIPVYPELLPTPAMTDQAEA